MIFFYRMIVKHNLKGMATKKNEIFGKFRRGGISSKISFRDYLNETVKIRLDNGQNILLVSIIFLLKYTKYLIIYNSTLNKFRIILNNSMYFLNFLWQDKWK